MERRFLPVRQNLDGRQKSKSIFAKPKRGRSVPNQFQGINRRITACHPQLRRQIKDIELLGGYRQKRILPAFQKATKRGGTFRLIKDLLLPKGK
jgi:hypothetical protein